MATINLDSILEGRRSQPHMLVEVLLDLQDQEGYLPEENAPSEAFPSFHVPAACD